MAKRPRNPWRRPGNSYRLGQRGPSPASLDEQRLTLYLPAQLLDWAEDQAARAGVATVQVYCATLLGDAIQDEQSRGVVADAEAKQGALEGFRAITDDPDYLAEWVASAGGTAGHPATATGRHEIHIVGGIEPPADDEDDEGAAVDPGEAAAVPTTADGPGPWALVVLRHAGMNPDRPDGFVAHLRAGEPVPDLVGDELLQALNALEVEYRHARSIDRRVAYALHRLAFEGQVLHTDAWAGAWPAETVQTLRAVQEAVDRVLSGEDIRYYPAGP